MIPTLDHAFLDAFDERLRALGAPICDAWAPGCSDEHIDALFRPLDIELPEEARVWWRWHNGTRGDVAMPHREIGTRGPFSIEDAAAAYENDREAMLEFDGLTGVVAAFNERPDIFFGCNGPRDEPVPIYTQRDAESPNVVLPSIRSLLEAWLQLIDSGAWELQDDGRWLLHFDRVPAPLRELGIY